MSGDLTETEERMVEALQAMSEQAEDDDFGWMRCINGEPMLWLPHDRALMPGHIYSEDGRTEAKISRCCEYHFDQMFEEGWTDPVTGEPGLTPGDVDLDPATEAEAAGNTSIPPSYDKEPDHDR